MNVPRDQGLFFTIFFTLCLGVVLTTWILMPVYHRGEEEKPKVKAAEILSPEESIRRSEQTIKRAEAILSQLAATPKEKPKKPATSKPKGGS